MPRFIDDSNESIRFSKELVEYENDWEFNLERTVLDITEQIAKQIKKTGTTQSKLSKLLGVSRSYISQLLNGKPNLRLSTLFKVAYAIGLKPKIFLQENAQLSHPEYVVDTKVPYRSHLKVADIPTNRTSIHYAEIKNQAPGVFN